RDGTGRIGASRHERPRTLPVAFEPDREAVAPAEAEVDPGGVRRAAAIGREDAVGPRAVERDELALRPLADGVRTGRGAEQGHAEGCREQPGHARAFLRRARASYVGSSAAATRRTNSSRPDQASRAATRIPTPTSRMRFAWGMPTILIPERMRIAPKATRSARSGTLIDICAPSSTPGIEPTRSHAIACVSTSPWSRCETPATQSRAAAWNMSVPTIFGAVSGKRSSIASPKNVPEPTEVSPTTKPQLAPISTASTLSRVDRRNGALLA